MSFLALAPQLHPTALAAKKYFSEEYGAKNFAIEEAIADQLSLRPTLTGHLSHGYLLCIDVSASAYSNSLDTFVVECVQGGFPIKFYVAIPSAKEDKDFASNLKKAKQRGVGIVEIANNHKHRFLSAVSLSLFGLRPATINDYPKAKRETIVQARETFLSGNPVKGCQAMYEELEVITRAFAIRARDEGWWKTQKPGEPKAPKKLDTDPWATVLKSLERLLDYNACRKKCPQMRDVLIVSARGVTDPRNLTSHKPSSLKKLIERDTRLRTWFETAQDLLKDWYKAVRPLKI